MSDSSHVLEAQTIQLEEKWTYAEEPVATIDKQVKKVRIKIYP